MAHMKQTDDQMLATTTTDIDNVEAKKQTKPIAAFQKNEKPNTEKSDRTAHGEVDVTKLKGGQRLIITVDGNIGSGKSTLIEGAARCGKGWIKAIPEPLEAILPHLDTMADTTKSQLVRDNALYDLNCALKDHWHRVKRELTNFKRGGDSGFKVIVVERNAKMGKVFLNLARSQLGDERYEEMMLAATKNQVDWDMQVLLYTPSDVCINRIQKRNRKEEAWILQKGGYGIQYLRELEAGMESNFETAKGAATRLDGRQSAEDVRRDLLQLLLKLSQQ